MPDGYRSECGEPAFERDLLAGSAAKEAALPIAWIEALPHVAFADIEIERPVLVLLDAGAVELDCGYGRRSVFYGLKAGSIGCFTQGTTLRASRWRWSSARRIAVQLEGACAGDPLLEEQFQRTPCRAELEFMDPELAALMRAMVREAASGGPHGRLYADSLRLGLMLRLQQRASAHTGRGRERARLSVSQLRALEHAVRESLGQPLTVAALAAVVGFSPAQFARLLKNTTGQSPHQYVLQIRLGRARELVLQDKLSLAAIAVETGFSSQSHMTSAFARMFGAPPGEMRRAARLLT
ncbi:MAG: AraC family transcriptional regulator [Burkholderiaceae bacterium]|nr:AraC family transcriptional regulator [Burkholderiaceae bacterium]